MIPNTPPNEILKTNDYFKPQSENIIKPIISNEKESQLFPMEILDHQVKKKREASRCMFKQDSKDTNIVKLYQSLSKILKSSKNTRKFDIKYYAEKSISLSGYVCEGVKGLRSLRSLAIQIQRSRYMSDQQLKDFTKTLKHLVCLESLNLELNCVDEITSSAIKSLCSALKYLTVLKRINLSFGYLKNSQTILQKISKIFKRLLSLESVSLKFESCRGITSADLRSLRQTFHNFPQLKALALSLNDSEMNDIKIQELAQGLQGLSGLKSLVLYLPDSKQITDEGIMSVGKILEGLISLQIFSLSLRGTQIGDSGLQSLGRGIKNLISLKQITLEFCRCPLITITGVQDFAQDLSNLSRLESFDLNFALCKIGDSELKSIFQSFSSFTSLKRLALSLSGSPVKSICLQDFAQALEILVLLESIGFNFSWCGITDAGVKPLEHAMKMLKHLQSLSIDFGGCKEITDEGVLAISQGFESLTCLKDITLNFWRCEMITDFGVKQLGKSMRSLVNLQNLDIMFGQCMNTSSVGIRSLCQDLESLTCLKRIILRLGTACKITKEEGKELKEGLKALCPFVEILI